MCMKIVKMLCISLFYVTALLLDNVSGENVVQEVIETVKTSDLTDQEFDLINPDMEKLLEKLEGMATSADKLNTVGETPVKAARRIYQDMIEVIDEVIEDVKNSHNAYRFLKAQGLDRIVAQNLKVDYDALKVRILLLLKVLFDVAPTTTGAVIPITIVDRVLDIFEKDNLALKAHSLDVLYVWLPENPRVQARVMKIKGLVPFYQQVSKLDTSVIKTLLDLFNTILKEHLKARNDAQRAAVVDNDKMKFYLRIGLLEHMSTPMVCNGLLNIFAKSWTYNTLDNNIILTIFDMIKNTQPFCMKTYQGKAKAKKLFTALLEYVKESENIDYLDSNGLNVTDISLILEETVEKLKYSVKDEM